MYVRMPRSIALYFRALVFFAVIIFATPQLIAQDLPNGWVVDQPFPGQLTPPPTNETQPGTTTIPRQPDPAPASPTVSTDTPAQLTMYAVLIDDGERIRNGLVWRVYQEAATKQEQSRLVSTHNQTSPVLSLKPGNYAINVAFGRANLTKRITLRPGAHATEEFVLNAGGLKLVALIGEKQPDANTVTYDVLEGEPDQSGQRATIISEARPGLIIRLNAGIYHIVSRYGDANATISTDVTVEAGKLTVATLSHAAATVTFRLVARPGGEALPQTRWTVQTKDGTLVKKSVGALPTHILAPGHYVVTAQNAEHVFKSEFEVQDGQIVSVEVVAQ